MSVCDDQIQQLIYHFQPDRESRPILLIGAGASYSSGVPLADEMVRQIARAAYAKDVLGTDVELANVMPGDWTRHLENQPWYKSSSLADNYAKAVEHLLRPREFRREFFRRMVVRAPGPGLGYRSLASLCRRGLVRTVLTTNFDTLAEDAFKDEVPHIKEVVAINRSEGDLVQFSPHRRAQIIYLHGAVETYRDQNSEDETQRLYEPLVSKIHEMIQYAPLVVFGYRGAEPSIMEHLLTEGISHSNNYNRGIFWCTPKRSTLHQNVLALKERIGSNFEIIEIDGFDEAVVAIDRSLSSKAGFQGTLDLVASKASHDSLTSFDSRPIGDKSISDIDRDLAFTTFQTYAENILSVQLEPTLLEPLLYEHGFISRELDGSWTPSFGLYVLFGLDVTEHFPHLQTVVRLGEKRRYVFRGNLLTQYRDVMDLLTSQDINPVLRIKKAQESVEKTAYHERALTELLVNMMAHRDYEHQALSEIKYVPGKSLTFSTPGGLPEHVLSRLQPDNTGHFEPKRGVHQVRNPLIADIFFALGRMDKQGTGLVDVCRHMQEHEGTANFQIADDNHRVSATLCQASADKGRTGQTATALGEREVYVANLLPILSKPKTLYRLPLSPDYAERKVPLFGKAQAQDPEPVAITASGYAISFDDLAGFKSWSSRVGYVDYLEEIDFQEMIAKPETRRHVVWLMREYWERYLRLLKPALAVDSRKKRAHFIAEEPEDLVVTYDSPLRRNIKRTVIKKRDGGKYPEFEIEALHYAVVQHGDKWAVQIKPTYVFTKSDALTPLPGYIQASRATRRFKFDRNPSVDSDLKFWLALLSGGKSAISLGGNNVNDLILDGSFAAIEAYEL